MSKSTQKRFEFCAFFASEPFNDWALFKVIVGQGIGYSFVLKGSAKVGESGMAVFGMNDKFVDVVPKLAFTKAAEKLNVEHFHTIHADVEEFQRWVLEKEDQYWSACNTSSFVINDFLHQKKGSTSPSQ